MFIEDQTFSPSYDLASPPTRLIPIPRQHVVALSQSSSVSPVEFTDRRSGEGVGEEPNETTATKPDPDPL